MRFASIVLAPCLAAACNFAGEELPIIEGEPAPPPIIDPNNPRIPIDDGYDGPAGVLDPTFATDGIARDFRGSIAGVAIADDETIYVTGTHYAEAGRGLAVVHYLKDGAIDRLFGHQGLINTTLEPFLTDQADAVQLLRRPDRSMFAIGRVKLPEDQFKGMAIVAMDRYGAFNDDFGHEGRALRIVTTAPPVDAVPVDAVLTRQGAIAIAGFIPGRPPNPFIARFDSSGDMNSAVMYGEGMKLGSIDAQPDGKLIAGGYYYDGGRQDLLVMRTLPTGVIDTSFADQGRLIVDLELIDVVSDVAVQPDGKIVVIGNTVDDRGFPRAFLMRLLPDGAPDLDFGNRAIQPLDNLGLITVTQVAISPTNHILIGGEDRTSGSTRAFLLRYDPYGQLDVYFGFNGMMVFNQLETPSYVSRIAFDSRGRILLAGATGDVVHFFLLRVLQ